MQFFGKWPAITRNEYGAGTLTYEGTYLSDELQRRVVQDAVKNARVADPDQDLPATVHAKHGVNQAGKRVNYYLNYSSDPQQFPYGGQRCRSADEASGRPRRKSDDPTMGRCDCRRGVSSGEFRSKKWSASADHAH